ncbi:MAG: hypothetical protein EZS28_049275, partial [Streblomastix strix]
DCHQLFEVILLAIPQIMFTMGWLFQKIANNHYPDQTEQAKTIEGSNPEHNPEDRCQRRQMGMILDHFSEQILDPFQWDGSWHLNSSNQKELAAVLFSQISQQQTLVGWETKYALFKTDNTTT